jgi:uncharacterized protein (TIGR02680 family)
MKMTNKWELHRAGLLNFWYYDEEYFHFADGKLLLRGSNGSGKSVTMQSFLPVLLDGKKSPDRLDPFGSRARRMEDYLLGEKEVVDRDERTGYLFLEYKRKNSDQFITTGIGLRAKRQKNMDFWGFVIFDNRRIGKDLRLYKIEKTGGETQKIPLTKRELINVISEGGTVVDSQSEYMELVNKHIFRFESVDAFHELIELLIQLRSPKLSKDFKPTVIYEILESSLPALTDEELRHLSETIENMDQAKQQLEQLEKDEQALKKLCQHYSTYNEYMLAEKANEYLKSEKSLKKLKEEKEQLEKQQREYEDMQTTLKAEIQQLTNEQEVLRKLELDLSNHEVFQAEEKRNETEKHLKNINDQIKKKEMFVDEKREQERKIEQNLNTYEDRFHQLSKKLAEQLDMMRSDALESSFSEHTINEEDFQRNREHEFDFAVWKREASAHFERLEQINSLWKEHDDIQIRYEETYKELGELNRELDQLKNEEKKWHELFEDEKSRLQENVFEWSKMYPDIKADDETFQVFLQRLNELYERYHFEEVKQPFTDQYYQSIETWKAEKIKQQHEMKLLENEIRETEEKLRYWKEQKDPEPERDMQTVQTRASLKEKGIPFVPLYAAVEFQEHVSEELRERIESTLNHAGLLDALIVEAELDIQYDRVITPNPAMMAHTLADYLKPDLENDSIVSKEKIEAVLRSIIVSDEQQGNEFFVINEAGQYSLGLLKGHAPEREKAKYIGRAARKRLRLEKIQQFEEELWHLNTQHKEKRERLAAVDERIRHITEGFQSFPTDQNVKYAYDQWKETKLKVESKEKETEKKNEKLGQIARKWQQIKQTLRSKTEGLDLEFSKKGYEDALSFMRTYLKELNEIQITHGNIVHTSEMIKNLIDQLETVQSEMDDAKGEINVLLDQRQRVSLELEHIESMLTKMGAEHIRQEIQRIRERLTFLTTEIPEKIKKQEGIRNQLSNMESKISSLERKLEFAKVLAQAWEELFSQELERGLVFIDENETGSLLDKAMAITKKFDSLLKENTRSFVNDQLNRIFFKELPNLIEYRPTQEPAEWSKQDPFIQFSLDEEAELKANDWKEKSGRIIILLDYKGQRVTPYFVLEEIEKDILLQKEYINEQDRELYEDIILKTIGRILRSRIQRAERWVKDMNALMEKRDTSSGLTFSIQWKPKTAETEEEMDTKDLVELLRMNSRLLKEEDLQRVTLHFRSKINRAREMLEERGQGNTLHQVIKEVLDYRKWFSFTLYYQKTNEPKRELTNQKFYKFSGGEKAMAMYIPLFAAAYSRYQEAAEDAPYIISLDEAFAGVDENNIRDMFALVEELGFNYIMNSQALWGDYDTVPALSICELVRPKNAPFVTVIRYHWDGKVKRLATNPDEEFTLASSI